MNEKKIPLHFLLLVLMIFLSAEPLFSHEHPELVKDLNTTVLGSDPGYVVSNGSNLFFNARDAYHGSELWILDQNEDHGARLVKDIYPGPSDGNPYDLAPVGDMIFFIADDGIHGYELWKSDGTPEGTGMVKDIYPGEESGLPEFILKSYRYHLVELNGILYFSANDGVHGDELWMSDGTEEGTVLVKDIRDDEYRGSSISYLTISDGVLFFRADNSATGSELWMSDGTPDGTVLVHDICQGTYGSNLSDIVSYNGMILFSANDCLHGKELWQSDGTSSGTQMVKNIFADHQSYAEDGNPDYLAVCNGSVFFRAENENGAELWSSNGTEGGTVQVLDIEPGEDGSWPKNLVCDGQNLLFTANTSVYGNELWKSDGTSPGTVLVKDISSGSASTDFSGFARTNTDVFFSAESAEFGIELWKTDGTEDGTLLVKDTRPGPTGGIPYYLSPIGDTLYFSAATVSGEFYPIGNDFYTQGSRQIWSSNGTEETTAALTNVNDVTDDALIKNITRVGDLVYFSIQKYSGSNNFIELWRSDGTEEGTWKIENSYTNTEFIQLSEFTDINGTLFFSAYDGTYGEELWKSNGTSESTMLVKDIQSGSGSSHPYSLTKSTAAQNELYFFADDGIHGSELWKCDGTDAGTQIIRDIHPGSTGCGSSVISPLDDLIMFQANTSIHGSELWVSNGTSEGTFMVKDLLPGQASSSPTCFTIMNDNLYFMARSEASGKKELWKSDGTAAGTVMVSDAPADIIFNLFAVDNKLFFATGDATHGRELWISDGTETGTGILKDINPGPESAFSIEVEDLGSGIQYRTRESFTEVNGTLFFVADDGIHGDELWKSDGTEAGTVLVKDIRSGEESGFPKFLDTNGKATYFGYLGSAGPILYFSAENDQDGLELWRSDGTESGTYLIEQMNPVGDSEPKDFLPVGKYLFFTAKTPEFGRELFRLDTMPYGDVNWDGTVDLIDSISILKILANSPLPPLLRPAGTTPQQIGMREALYSIKKNTE